LTKSFTISEKTAEHDTTKRVTAGDMGVSPGSPIVVTTIAAIMLDIIAMSNVLLGLVFQKCPLSLTLNIKNMAE
jgi:hypothetical protein